MLISAVIRLACAIAIIAIAGCASQPLPHSTREPAGRATPTESVSAPLEKADRDLTAQELLNAASEYLTHAESAPPDQRADLRLKAAAALIRVGRIEPAARLLQSVDTSNLAPIYRARQQLSQARIELHRNRPSNALSLIDPWLNQPGLSPQLHAELRQSRARANLLSGRALEAIRDLITRERYLTAEQEKIRNLAQTWEVLGRLRQSEMLDARRSSGDATLSGWIDLAAIQLEHGHDPFRLQNEVEQWRAQYPGHSANQLLQHRAGTVSRAVPMRIRRIALLLPLASKYGRAAEAVHDGFMAMHRVDGDPEKPAVTVYDIGGEPGLAPVYYRLAAQEDAEMIVGPLGKLAVNELITSGIGSLSILLLGSVANSVPLPDNVYQFDLSPEHDARQTALRAYLDGHRTAAVLYPETDWGERVHHAFAQRWEQLGGMITESRAYIDGQTDYSSPIKELLNIVNSYGRKRELSRLLGHSLKFQPRRRRDIDFLFLVAKTAAARLLKPQINFFHAHDLPVYSTSHVYAGKPDPVNDADLNGILFGDMPWMLNSNSRIRQARRIIQGDWAYRHTPLDRLYALGMDAYAITRSLALLRDNPDMLVEGATANLRMNRNGQIIRQLNWAYFDGGRPIVRDIDISAQLWDLSQYGDTTHRPPFVTRSVGGRPSP